MAGNDIGFAAVARLAGVSTATVSNTLNRPHLVAEPTRARVLAAIADLDFVPNRAAAALRQGSSRLIGLVVPDIENPFYAAIARGVAEAADRRDFTVALCVSDDDPAKEERQFAHLAELRAAGALVVPLTADSSRLDHLRMVGTRLVLVDRVSSTHDGCSVAVDDVRGGELAVEHLLAGGRRRIALVNGSVTIPQCRDRRTGARAAMTAAGLDPDSLIEVETPEMTIEAGQRIGRQLSGPAGAAPDARPDGIFCTNDQLAVGVLRGLAQQGVDLPGTVAVVGYGDLTIASESLLPLTSVRQPTSELGLLAVKHLLDELDGKDAHVHSTSLLRPELVVRASAR